MSGTPVAGGTVALYQTLYAWTPPCTAHIPCTHGALLSTQSATASSAIDGTVIFAPALLHGEATKLQASAVSGNTASVTIGIEQH